MNKSSAKKHPLFLLAMYPPRMWAAITRGPHHDESQHVLYMNHASNLQGEREKHGDLQSPEAVNVLSSAQSPLQKNTDDVLKETKCMTDLQCFA
jgi:hypothetical protein